MTKPISLPPIAGPKNPLLLWTQRLNPRAGLRFPMAISGDLRVSATLGSYLTHQSLRASFPPSKVEFAGFLNGKSSSVETMTQQHVVLVKENKMLALGHQERRFSIQANNNLSSSAIGQEAESFLLNTINMPFFERLNLAWKIMFPSAATRKNSNARIAKQRLKMILFSDRCAVSDEAKRKIVTNIVKTLSDFVEIESQDKVQLSVTTDSDLGTVYSVTVPVRRVKPEYQEADDVGKIANVEYMDTGETSGSVDVRFDFFIPD